jgi:hypothetical protein
MDGMQRWYHPLQRRERVFAALFCCTGFQLATQIPYLVVVPGERSKVFSGLLCGATLIALLAARRERLRWSLAGGVCSALALLCLASGIASGAPGPSLWRGMTLVFSAAGGFWCGRLVFEAPAQRRLLVRFGLLLLALLLLLGLAGFFLHGDVRVFTGMHKHEYNGLLLLLGFAPLGLIQERGRRGMLAGIGSLLVGYGVIALSLDPMVWFPPLLLLGWVLLGVKRKRRMALPLLLAFLAALWLQQTRLPAYFFEKESINVWIRVENLFFSTHLARQRPLLGIGLTAPRTPYLENYRIRYPHVTKAQFAAVLPHQNRSSENQFLTFLGDLGIPFAALYGAALLLLYGRLTQRIAGRAAGEPQALMFLWIPLTGALLHLQVYDGLLHPQICWFFHLLLGMIPAPGPERAAARAV